jgi:hypothetical protein
MSLLLYYGVLNQNTSNPEFNYTAFTAPPTKGSTTVLTLGTNGETIEVGDLAGNTDLEINADWDDRLAFNGVSGTPETPIRLFLNGNRIGGSNITAGQQVLGAALNNPNYIEFYDGFIQGNPTDTVVGITGTVVNPALTGAVFKWQGIHSYDMSFANFQTNVSTTLEEYQSLTLIDCIGTGHAIEGENFYMGDTDKADGSYSIIRNLIMKNCFGTNKGRDGLQINSVVPATSSNDVGIDIRNLTIYDVGKEQAAGQGGLIQVQNSNGVIKDCLFDTAFEFGNIFTHGLEFNNCFFNITRKNALFIGDLTDSAYGANAEAANSDLGGTPITFRNCTFRFAVPFDDISPFNVQEKGCDIQFIDCTFTSDQLTHTGGNVLFGGLVTDNRSSTPNSITNTGATNVNLAAIPAPTYTTSTTEPFVESAITDYGLITSAYHYNLRLGYRVPTQLENVTITNNTIEERNVVNASIGFLEVEGNGAPTWSLVSGTGDTDNAQFNINGNELRASVELDFADGATRSIRVRALNSDDNSFSVEAVLTINVTEFSGVGVTDIITGVLELEEGNINPALVTFLSVDALANPQTATFSLVSGTGDTDNASFSIVGGNLLQINEVTDFSTKSTYNFRLQADNGEGVPYQEAFTLTILEDRITVLVSFGTSTKSDPSTPGETWNLAHTDNTSGYSLNNLVDTDGNVTGLNIVVDAFMGDSDLGVTSTPGGQIPVYNITAYSQFWNSVNPTGTARGFDITGMDNAITYTIKTQGTIRSGTGFGDTNLLTHQLERSQPNEQELTVTNCTEDVESLLSFAPLQPTSGEITFRSVDGTGTSPICLMEISWPAP